MKRNRFFTIMVVPESSKASHWTLSTNVARALMVLGVLLAVGLAAVLFDYVKLTSQVAENKALRKENRQLSIRLQNLDNNLTKLSQRLEDINKFQSKIAQFTLLNDPDRSKMLAMGPLDPGVDESTHGFSESRSDKDFSLNETIVNTTTLLFNVDRKMRELASQSKLEEQNIHQLYDLVQEKQSFLRSMPSVRPTVGWVTSTYGYRISPYTGFKKLHDGIDIATSVGTPIVAPADGVITFAGMKPGYGLVMILDHGYGIETRYAHNSRFYAKPGDVVKRGQKIAATGNTGLSTGPHLHYEVRINGIPIDPAKYFLD